jgi:4-amino-4-deoxy-L-arabinose transferase-like glycosyltransferase
MSSESSTNAAPDVSFLPTKAVWRWLIILGISALALAVRAYEIDDYPLDSHPVKQYRSALVSRQYYYQLAELVPEWKREVARDNVKQMPGLGPTVLEHIASFAYLLTNGERIWIPRLLSATSWVVGGIFLYLLARQLASAEAAIISTSFYLFLPFGVMVSRNFQPDPMMIMMMIVSLYAIVRYHSNPSRKHLLIASAAAAFAIFVKPVSLFIIFAGFTALVVSRQGLRRAITNPDNILFFAISLLPNVLFYGNGLFIDGTLQKQSQASFLPALLVQPFFYQFWLKHVHATIGFSALVGALFGVLLFSRGWKRNFVLGLWIGYAVYGMVFTYHIHTHNYYQLPFIPIVALSIGPLGALILVQLRKVYTSWPWRLVIGGILLLAIILNIGLYARERQELPDFTADIQLSKEIGEIVNHSTRTIMLAPHGGRSYRYHGQFSGTTWPTRGDENAEGLYGLPKLSVEKRVQLLGGDGRADYFIVVNFEETKYQQDLTDYLTSNYPIIAENDRYLVFDLREA